MVPDAGKRRRPRGGVGERAPRSKPARSRRGFPRRRRGKAGGSGAAGAMSREGAWERRLPGARCVEDETGGDPEIGLEGGGSFGRPRKPRRIQEGAKEHQCPECGKTFKRKDHLQSHLIIHTGEKPHKCLECEKRFSQRGNLYTHQRIHSGEKPHKCLEYGKRFSQRGNLYTHQRIHSGEKPYKCLECGKRFSQRGELYRHQRIHSVPELSLTAVGHSYGNQQSRLSWEGREALYESGCPSVSDSGMLDSQLGSCGRDPCLIPVQGLLLRAALTQDPALPPPGLKPVLQCCLSQEEINPAGNSIKFKIRGENFALFLSLNLAPSNNMVSGKGASPKQK